MHRLWRWYVLSNLHIALGSVIFCLGGMFFFDTAINYWILLFLFVGTLCTYILHRLISARRLNLIPERHQRFRFLSYEMRTYMVVLTILGGIGLLSFIRLPPNMQLYLSLLTALSVIYMIPIMTSGKRLRDINGLKIFVVAMVWSGVFLTGYVGGHTYYSTDHVILIYLEKFLFIFALTLPFDIRDKELDMAAQVGTWANYISEVQLKNLILLCLFVCTLLCSYLYFVGFYGMGLYICLLIFYGIQAYLSLQVEPSTGELYYLGILDGLIIAHGIIYIAV